MRITLRHFEDRQTVTSLMDVKLSPDSTVPVDLSEPLALEESSLLLLTVHPDTLSECDVRLQIGNKLVASTLVDRDFPEFCMELDDSGEAWRARGRLLQNWVGIADMEVQVRDEVGGDWRPVCRMTCLVSASKMDQDAYRTLCAEIADQSVGLLLDIYGKTYVGLQSEQRRGEAAPLALIERIGRIIEEFEAIFSVIARRPARRVRQRPVRTPAFVGQAVTPTMLHEACRDTSLLTLCRGRTVFREQVDMKVSATCDVPENRAISGFLVFLSLQLEDIASRTEGEIRERESRRAHRSGSTRAGKLSWYEEEDMARLRILRDMPKNLDILRRRVNRLASHPFLPASPAITSPPPATQTVRFSPGYQAVYHLIREHLTAFGVQLDGAHLLSRAKAVPVLYEWWCVLRVMEILGRHLSLDPAAASSEHGLFREEPGDVRKRLIIEFSDNEAVDYLDTAGRLVRLRYQPRYESRESNPGVTYGLLAKGKHVKTPDIAIELFDRVDAPLAEPSLVIILDAKYTHASHREKINEVRGKYDRIGTFEGGRTLSRQIWALTPSPPDHNEQGVAPWVAACTVDHRGFMEPGFDTASESVCGAVRVVPMEETRETPLEPLLVHLLTIYGIDIRQAGEPSSVLTSPE